jgi:hypothetical protein
MPRHTIEAAEKPILDIFCDKYLFRIPPYQRPYAWTTEQTSELLDDISIACSDTASPSGPATTASPSIVKLAALSRAARSVQSFALRV